MIRLLFMMGVFVALAFANITYKSIHPTNSNTWQPRTLKAQMIEAVNSGSKYTIYSPITILAGVGGYEDKVCIGNPLIGYYSKDWQRYKVYIPAGTTYFKLTVKTIPNSIMRIRLKYKANSNNIINQNTPTVLSFNNYASINNDLINRQDTIELQGSFATNVSTYVIADGSYFQNSGGWLYISVANDDYFYHSAYFAGNITNASIAASYKISNAAAFQNWLQNTIFNQADEPIDDATSMMESGLKCDGTYFNESVVLDHSGSDPVALCTDSGGTWNTNEERCVSNAETTCVNSLGQWNNSNNSCTSKVELDCIADSTTSWYKADKICLYDDSSSDLIPISNDNVKTFESFIANEQGWQTKLKIKNTNTTDTLTQTIKILDEQKVLLVYEVDVDANKIWNGVIFKHAGKVYVGPATQRTNENIAVSENTSSYKGSINIESEGDINQIILSEIISLETPLAPPGVTITPASNDETSGGASGEHDCPSGYTYDAILGICDGEVPSNPIVYSPPPSPPSTGTGTRTCSTGYVYDALLGICDKVSGANPVAEPEVAADNSDKCSEGQVYNALDGICELKVETEIVGKLEKTVQILKKDPVTINGYFIHYASGIFDWLYLDKSLKYMYKLEGIDAKTNLFVWSKNLASSFYGITASSDKLKIKFGPTNSTHLAAKIVTNRELSISGFFAKYDLGAFSWVYTTPDGKFVAKLDGLNEDGSFKWIILKEPNKIDSFDTVYIGSNNKIIFN